MASVIYNDCSFLIGGQPVWLVSGEIHYFRIPHELWRDRLVKAKRAGLNCISTCVPWNFHESQEGQWIFSEQRDIVSFVKQAHELGLYVILRPGPFVGADVDFAGLPGWLSARSGIAFRTTNAAYTHYFDKFFRQVLSRLADMQVSRGGNIVLIQNENSYVRTNEPDRTSYLEFISQLFRRSGFDIPILTANCFTDPVLEEAVDTYCGWDKPAAGIRQLRMRQPHKPAFVSEFYTGSADAWGTEHEFRSPRETARKALEILGCGAQFNYYMFAGGTNFAFWAGRIRDKGDAFQATSYDYDAPIAEGGSIGEKYYLLRIVNIFANHMGKYLAQCVMDEPGAGISDSSEILNIFGPRGRWAVVTNNGREDIKQVNVTLPSGKSIDVSLEKFGAAAVPFEMKLLPHKTLDYSNVMPLGFFNDHFLVVHGPAGFDAQISIEGKVLKAKVPVGDDPKLYEHQGVGLVVINSELAMRMWVMDNCILFGPEFVGEDPADVLPAVGAKHYSILLFDEGKLTRKKLKEVRKPTRTSTVNPPKFGPFKRLGVSSEPVSNQLDWKTVEKVKDVDRMGVSYGYAWYRVDVNAKRPHKCSLFFPKLEDRGLIYLNGSYVSTWGRGEGASRKPVSVQMKKGANTIAVLADNLGRGANDTRLGEPKGVFGAIYDAKPLKVIKSKLQETANIPKRLIPRALAYMQESLQDQLVMQAEFSFTLPKVNPVHISFGDVPHHVGIICNDKPVSLLIGDQNNYGDVTLTNELCKGKNIVKLLLWGEAKKRTLAQFEFVSLTEKITESQEWKFRPWTLPSEISAPGGKGLAVWFVSKFRHKPTGQPLFINIYGAKKGQLFLNGRNLGRFWTIGPQKLYYLPECWLKDENELMIFEEQGRSPSKSTLVFKFSFFAKLEHV